MPVGHEPLLDARPVSQCWEPVMPVRNIHWTMEHGLQVLNRLDLNMAVEQCWTCRHVFDGYLN